MMVVRIEEKERLMATEETWPWSIVRERPTKRLMTRKSLWQESSRTKIQRAIAATASAPDLSTTRTIAAATKIEMRSKTAPSSTIIAASKAT